MTAISIKKITGLPVAGLLCITLQFSQAYAEGNREDEQKNAENKPRALKINGELGVGFWSSNRLLDDQRGILAERLALNAGAVVADHFNIRLDGWGYHSQNAHGDQTRGRLRDAYLRWDGEETELRIGPQIIAWGRADRINPTDNLTARDYTAPFPTDEEQRYGAPAASLSQYIGPTDRLNFIVKKFRPSIGPNDINEQQLERRPTNDNTAEYAAKLDHTGDQFDWSLSYFKGREKLRSLQIERSGNLITGVSRGYAPLEAFGADGVHTMGPWGLRGELAYLKFRDTDFASSAGRLSHWFGVLGVEKNQSNNASVNVQYYFRRFTSRPDVTPQLLGEEQLRMQVGVANNQLHRYQHGVSVRLAQRLWNDRIDYELVGLMSLREHDYAFRPRLNLRYTDQVRLTIGADAFRGNMDGYLGSLRKNSLIFAEVVFIY